MGRPEGLLDMGRRSAYWILDMGCPEGILDMGRRSAYGILDIGYGSHKTQKKTTPHKRGFFVFSFQFSVFTFVEMAGIEPASKQGTNMLSTRLSWP